MTISTPVLLGIFVLCCTGCAQRACRRLSLNPGYGAMASLTAALFSGIAFQPVPILSVLPVSLLLPVAAVLLAGRLSLHRLLAAFTGATLGWLMHTLFPAFSEPSLFTAVPAALLSVLFFKDPRDALAAVLAAPILGGGLIALSDWYLFDCAVIPLGSAAQLDAQACGVLLLGILLSAPQKKSAARKEFHQNEA